MKLNGRPRSFAVARFFLTITLNAYLKNLTKAPKPDFWQHHFKTVRPNFLKLTAFLAKDERLRLKKCNFRLKIHGQAMLGTVP